MRAHDPSTFFNGIEEAQTPAWYDAFLGGNRSVKPLADVQRAIERPAPSGYRVCPECGAKHERVPDWPRNVCRPCFRARERNRSRAKRAAE